MTIIYNDHLQKVLTKYYLDPQCASYNGRWNLWLTVNNYMDEHLAMMLKSEDQANRILRHAHHHANLILQSETMKLLRGSDSDT